MRITKLRLCNLHSLKGSFELNFLQPPLSEAALFAITGDTGSGKSTLLDAITLALYGSVHRYNNPVAKTDEVMTQGEGVCWAEVEFEANGMYYMARYERRRARNKADGNLQAPRRMLSKKSGNAWLPLTDKIRDTNAQVEAITGLDFRRFTRSVLLAQGDFAAFLKAPKDDRSALLEQITGTEIYSEISKKCHERYKLEEQKINELRQKREKLALPSEEEQKNAEEEFVRLTSRLHQLNQHCQDLRTKLDKLLRRENLHKELQQLKAEQSSWQQQMNDFSPKQKQLKLHEQAWSLVPQLRELQDLIKTQTEHKIVLKQLDEALQSIAAKLQTLPATIDLLHKELLTKEELYARQQKIFDRVENLDKEISKLKGELSEQEAQLQPAFRQMKKMQNDWNELLQKLKSCKDDLLQLNAYISSNSNLIQIVDRQEVISDKINRYLNIFSQIKSDEEKLQAIQEKLQALDERIKEQKVNIDRREEDLIKKERRLAEELGVSFIQDAWMWLKKLDDRLLQGSETAEQQEELYQLRQKAVELWPDWKQDKEELIELRLQRNPLLQDRQQQFGLWQSQKELLEEKQKQVIALAKELREAIGQDTTAKLQGVALAQAAQAFGESLRAFRQMQNRQKELENSLDKLNSEKKYLAQALEQHKMLVDRLETKREKLKEELKSLNHQRQELLGEQPLEEARQQLNEAVKSARMEYEAKQQEQTTETTRWQEKSEQKKQLEQRVAALQSEIAQKRQALEKAARTNGFKQLEDLKAAILPHEEYNQLTRQAQRLREQHIRLQERQKRIKDELVSLENELKNLRSKEVEQELLNFERQREEAIEERARIGERRMQWKELEVEKRTLENEIRRQQAEYARWEALHALIGSADGKKFRTFAQTLTLRRLSILANRHLQQLNGRYLLRVKPDSTDLELEIVDTYQADRSRSVFSLSGGESFLASLALALGLSDMVGHRARIHSLFIDEGFGSLDATSLEQALSALEQLQSSGKTIGLISHVRAMQERISVQIRLKKLGGGRSTLEVWPATAY